MSYDGPAEGYLDFAGLIAGSEPEDIWVDVDDDQPTVLIFTSGTTALPKGVMVTYLDMTAYVTNTMNPADPDVHDKTLVSVPFFHIAGQRRCSPRSGAGARCSCCRSSRPRAG